MFMNYIKKFENFLECDNCNISDELKYALGNGITESFRYGSDKFLEVFNEAKENIHNLVLNENDIELLGTDIGLKGLYDREEVLLDLPFINESKYKGKDVKLGSPKRGGNKAYYVYVKNPKTDNIIKVEFGSSMKVKLNDADARKNYNARHGCSKGKHNDKTKPGYWSCRLPTFSNALGLSYSGSAKWW